MNIEATLNELAATVVAIDETDLQELARLHAGFETLAKQGDLPDRAKKVTSAATERIERVILQDCEDPLRLINQVAEAITELQRLLDPQQVELRGPDETMAASADAFGETSSTEAAPRAPSPAAAPEVVAPAAPMDVAAIIAADPDLFAEFVAESLEHLERAEGILLDLESNPDDSEGLNAIFRAFHTIKGTSGFLSLARINAVAHKAETLLDRARQGEIQLAGGYADLALESTDMLKRLIEWVQQGGSAGPEPPGVDALLAKLESPDEPLTEITAHMRIGDMLVAQEKVTREQVEDVIAASGSGEKIGQKLIEKGLAKPRDVVSALRAQKQISGSSDSTLRVSMERLDMLIDMVGELVIGQAMVSQDSVAREASDQNFTRKIGHLGKITRELQDLTLSMRMVPLKSTFQKMARLVRDLAKKSGKQVRFLTDGEDTEIDRNMVDSIGDPLVHMMRNAVDHGIESPAERQAKGKPPTGTVTLRAYHAGGKVVIEMQDDGHGLDREKILAKARERGIVDSDKELSESEVYELLFAPGFSTAEKVTDVSGRGVGMDVVKRNIESMRGRVEITSKLGHGTTFTIRLPLTLAIIDGMILQVGHENYILPTLNIEQAFQPEPAALSTVTGRGELVLLRGQLIPIYRLHRVFGVSEAMENATEGLLVVVEHEGHRCALLADSLLGQQQVVIKSLGSALGEVEGVSGAAILGDGRVGLILDVAGVIRAALDDGGTRKDAAA